MQNVSHEPGDSSSRAFFPLPGEVFWSQIIPLVQLGKWHFRAIY